MNNTSVEIDWDKYRKAINVCQPMRLQGRVVKLSGIIAEASGPRTGIGSLCAIENATGQETLAEVVGFRDKRLILMPLGEMRGLKPGSTVLGIDSHPMVPVGEAYLGRVIDGLGRPIDDKGRIRTSTKYPIYGNLINPLKRQIIRDVLDVGVCSINSLITLGKGQRIGVMAGSGVGKSVLMSMMARNTAADVSIIALIGERGREVKEFIENNLGESGLKKSVVVAATSDTPALVRIRAAYFATALAEYFCDKGSDVLLMMDSITRVAMSLREVGLAAGEPPSAKGYTPSVFSQLPKLLERSGNFEKSGSITGIYNVLVEGDDMNEPIADTVRSIVDGHIILSRELAQQGIYPAIDVRSSISRVMDSIVTKEHLKSARRFIKTFATYREAEDLISIGAYVDGSNPDIDFAKEKIGTLTEFLQQDQEEKSNFNESVSQLKEIIAVE